MRALTATFTFIKFVIRCAIKPQLKLNLNNLCADFVSGFAFGAKSVAGRGLHQFHCTSSMRVASCELRVAVGSCSVRFVRARKETQKAVRRIVMAVMAERMHMYEHKALSAALHRLHVSSP